jgi:FMN-dependent NADH-azoreductase
MSSTLVCRPLNVPGVILSNQLKYILQKRYQESYGNKFSTIIDMCLTEMDIPYIDGLIAAGIEDAVKVKEEILKFRAVRLNEE